MEPFEPTGDVEPLRAPAAATGAAPEGAGPAAPEGFAAHEVVLAEGELVLDEIDRALARLDDRTYGTCEVCGAAIDDEALAASPTTRTCRAHLPLADRT